MVETIKNAWKIPELRKRILYTVFMLAIFRLGSHIFVPYINTEVLAEYISANSMLGLFNIISGDNLKTFSIFAMGITPYINSSIIVQLLTIVIPSWERMSKEGEEGRRKLSRITRYVALALAALQGLGTTISMSSILTENTVFVKILVTVVITAGTAFLLWMGESITDKGIGNGISLLIFIGIVSSVPTSIINMIDGIKAGTFPAYMLIIILVFVALAIVGVVAVNEGTRKIPVQYAKRVVGRKMYGGQNTHLPLKVNQSGVMPVIFASVITMFPSTLASFFPNTKWLASFASFMSWGKFFPTLIYLVLIIAFSYFYTMISFNPVDVADNLRQYGGVIPGIRTGAPTTAYIKKVVNRLTISGALFLSVIAILPIIAGNLLNISLQFGGTSLLIVVGVALETVKALEQQLVVRNYKGFLK